MARARTNPDPLVVEYERQNPPGGKFTIHARRDGGYVVFNGEKVITLRPSKLHASYGAPRWPSNRLQAEALRAAQLDIETLMEDRLR